MSFDFNISGLDEAISAFNKRISMLPNESKEALTSVTLDLLSKAVKLAPLDTGDLRGSGFAEVEKVEGNLVGTVGFTEPYALRQHEEMEYNHPRGGQAKYLEQPFLQNTEKYITKISNSVKKGLE